MHDPSTVIKITTSDTTCFYPGSFPRTGPSSKGIDPRGLPALSPVVAVLCVVAGYPSAQPAMNAAVSANPAPVGEGVMRVLLVTAASGHIVGLC